MTELFIQNDLILKDSQIYLLLGGSQKIKKITNKKIKIKIYRETLAGGKRDVKFATNHYVVRRLTS